MTNYTPFFRRTLITHRQTSGLVHSNKSKIKLALQACFMAAFRFYDGLEGQKAALKIKVLSRSRMNPIWRE